jgi:hypothetical protein
VKLLRHDGLGRAQEVDVAVLGGAGRSVVDFGAGKSLVSVSVAAPAILSTSVIVAQVAAIATANHSADEHLVEDLEVRAGAPVQGVGFTLYARTRAVKLYGKYTLAWTWS